MKRKRKKPVSKKTKILFFTLLIFDSLFFVFLIWQVMKISCRQIQSFFVSVAAWEQMEHKTKVKEHVDAIENQLLELEERLMSVREEGRAISLEEKVEIQTELENLEKEAQKVEIEFYHHKTDFSLEFNPFKDNSIDNLFNKTWNLPLKIDRFIRSYEEMVFRGNLTKDQLRLIQKNLNSARWQIDEIKNAL